MKSVDFMSALGKINEEYIQGMLTDNTEQRQSAVPVPPVVPESSETDASVVVQGQIKPQKPFAFPEKLRYFALIASAAACVIGVFLMLRVHDDLPDHHAVDSNEPEITEMIAAVTTEPMPEEENFAAATTYTVVTTTTVSAKQTAALTQMTAAELVTEQTSAGGATQTEIIGTATKKTTEAAQTEKTDITATQLALNEYGTLMQGYYTALMNTWHYGGESAASCDFDFTGLGRDIDLTFEWEDYKLTYRAIVGCDWIVYYFFDAEPKQGQDYAQFENDNPDIYRVNKWFIKGSEENYSIVQVGSRLVKPENTSLENGVWHCVGMLFNISDNPGFHGKNAGTQIRFTENPRGDKSDEELISYDPIEFAAREFPLYPCAEVKLEPGLAENDEALELYAEQRAWNEEHPLTRCANTPFGNFYFSDGKPEPYGLLDSGSIRGGSLIVRGIEPTLQYTSSYGDSIHDGQYNSFLFVLFEKPVNVPAALSE